MLYILNRLDRDRDRDIYIYIYIYIYMSLVNSHSDDGAALFAASTTILADGRGSCDESIQAREEEARASGGEERGIPIDTGGCRDDES